MKTPVLQRAGVSMPWEEAALFRRNSITMPDSRWSSSVNFELSRFSTHGPVGSSDCHGHRKMRPNNKAFDDV